MTPELREHVLSLPLDVRRELAKCEGPFWLVARYSTHDVHLLCREAGEATERDAYLPVSPIAIALHAAKLLGAFEATITVDTGGGFTYANATTSPSEGEEVPYQFADVESDPTGHRAAIALLVKVMQCAAS